MDNKEYYPDHPHLKGCIPFGVEPLCLYGDPLCPCQDGDACHYEGDNPVKICGNCACLDICAGGWDSHRGKCRNHSHVADFLGYCPEWIRAN